MPTSPVRRVCVPPQAETSQSGISTIRILPLTAGGFRSVKRLTPSSSTQWRSTGRSSQTTPLAASSTRSTARQSMAASPRSMVLRSSPSRDERVGAESTRSKAAERMCWPVCCCMWSNRRGQSTWALTAAPGPSGGADGSSTCQTRSLSSTCTSTTGASPRRPRSASWPPVSG